MADLSKIVCLEQDCRHGTEQTGGSGSGNDTYTKAEIDSKDAAVKAIADKSQSTATSAATAAADAQSVNHTQDRKIADLQKAAHTHSNKDIIDKTEQPFTTADQAKLNSLENYEHPTHKANSKGFYKFASDDLGHVSETEAVTKKDITDLGIPGTDTKYDRTDLYNLGCALRSDIDPSTYAGELPLCFAKAGLSEGLATLKDLVGGLEEIAYIRLYGWSDKKREAWLIVGGDGNLGCLCLHGKYSNPYIIKTPSDEDKVVGHTYILPAGKDGTFALTSDIPDISGKQDKSTAVTHNANTAVGSTTKPVYIAANGAATPIAHSINSDVPANAKFTDTVYTHPTTAGNKHIPAGGSSGQILRWSADGTAVWGADNNTTYSDATQSVHGLMTAADKKKLDDLDASRFMNLNNSAVVIYGAGGTAQWYRLGTLVSSGNFNTAIIRILSGDGANGYARQNSSFEIHIKDAWQSTETASAKACGVTVYRINCANAEVKVIPTAHDTYTVWVYLPWGYWNGDYAVYGKYKSWTSQRLTQSDEPEGTGANTEYYDQAFLTSTVAAAKALTETAWTAVPTTGAADTVYNSLTYLKSGNMIFVQGAIGFKAGLNNPCCGTMPSDLLPDDYQDHVFTAWNLLGGVPTAYPVVLAKDGKITLMNPTSKAQWFEAGRAYNFNFNYHIG